jgi:hypothetical protein
MRAQFGVFVLAAALLTSCDTFESREYRITHAGRGDTTRVQRILRDVAAATRIPRSAPTPYDSPTIALYRDSKLQLRASVSHGDIRVILMRYDWPAPKRSPERTVCSCLPCLRHLTVGSDPSHTIPVKWSVRLLYTKRPNQSLQPTAGRRTERLKDEL